MSQEIVSALSQAPLFQGLESQDLERFVRGVRPLSVQRNEVLFHRGGPCNGTHLLLEGQIKLAFVSAQGNEKVVEIIRPGQTFGEALMFMERPYIVTAQALADSRLLLISKTVLFEEMERDARFSRKMIAGLSQRLHHLMHEIESLSLQSGRERVIGYLLREEPDAPAEGPTVVRLPTTKGTIASRLNLTQEHFSRILHELADSGLIRLEGRTIHIPDLARLRDTIG
jgi:CRP/FNR family transcriptional regulator, dissimilatory nitrate respiration regulator